MKICGIYGLICPIDKKIRYIGKTVDIKARLRTHKYSTKKKIKNNSRLNHKDNWIKKLLDLGIYNQLSYVMIETYKRDEISSEFLYKREQIIIKSYKDGGHNLVNGCDGGIGADTESLKKLWDSGVYDYSNMNHQIYYKKYGSNEIRHFLTISECKRTIGISRASIIRSINEKRKINGKHMFSNNIDINEQEYVDISNNAARNTRKSVGKKLIMVNISTKKCVSYESYTQCSKENGLDKSNIKKCLKNKTVYNDSYIFIDEQVENINELIKMCKQNTIDRTLSGTSIMSKHNKNH